MAGRTIARHMFKQSIQLYKQSVAIKEASRRLGLSRAPCRWLLVMQQTAQITIRNLRNG